MVEVRGKVVEVTDGPDSRAGGVALVGRSFRSFEPHLQTGIMIFGRLAVANHATRQSLTATQKSSSVTRAQSFTSRPQYRVPRMTSVLTSRNRIGMHSVRRKLAKF
jgi:hypothetical protein